MKKQSLLFVLLASAMLSCTDAMQESFDDDLSALKFQELDKTNLVSYDNIVALNTAQTAEKEEGRPMDGEQDIDCITDGRGDTLLYVCSKRDGGWTMYSSDTRIPPILAQSDKGSFSDVRKNENAMAWIQTMAEDVKLIRSLGDDQLKLTQEEIEANRDFWRSVSDPDGFVKDWLKKHSAKTLPHDDFLPTGHYELYDTEYITEVYDSIGRLTTTNWEQEYNYNMYCPYKSNSNTEHAPAGCVAISGAQILYFLHYHFGVPETAPSEAYCFSKVNQTPYNWNQYSYNSTVWDTMNNIFFNWGSAAAPLIANVGKLVDMVYGDYGSSSNNYSLPAAFAEYNIMSIYSAYNTDSLKSSLLNGMPVILGGYPAQQNTGHSFISDRYKRTKTTIKRTYAWVWDTPPSTGTIMPFVPRKVEYTYESPVISWIGMNWGWGPGYNVDQEWFTLTGDWILASYNYTTNRDMVYGFHPINAGN